MALRSAKERLVQSVLFEAIGLITVTPVYAWLFDKGNAESLNLFLVLTLAISLWAPIHNEIFDRVEYRMVKRTACKRPGTLRACHALSIEVTAIAVTMPLIAWLGDHSVGEVLVINAGLTAFYTVYAFVFYLVYDLVRPIELSAQRLSVIASEQARENDVQPIQSDDIGKLSHVTVANEKLTLQGHQRLRVY